MGVCDVGNIKIAPIDATWEIEERFCVKVQDVLPSDLDGKYFNIFEPTTEYYVWFNVDTTGVDPEPVGKTGIEVEITENSTPVQIAEAISTAVVAATDYVGSVEGDDVLFTFGTTQKIAENPVDVDSGLLVSVVSKGASTYLGILDGDVEPNFTEDKLDVLGHQFGTSILAQLRQGNNAEVTLALKESSQSLYKEIFGAGGDTLTPASGTELYGWGDSKQGANVIPDSRRLVFHPVGKAANDKSEDLTFWLAYPNPDSIVYSGENFNLLNVTFTTFLDLTKPRQIRRFCFGDASQDLSA